MFNLIVLILVTIVFLMFGYLITHVDIFFSILRFFVKCF